MNLIKTLSVGLAAVALLSIVPACTSDDSPIDWAGVTTSSNQLSLGTRSISDISFLNITYNGKTYYNVPTTYDENGDFVFGNHEFASIYEKEIAGLEEMSIDYNSDTDITIYRSLSENLESEELTLLPPTESSNVSMSPSTRISRYEKLAIVELFDDKGFGAPRLEFSLCYAKLDTCVRRLKDDKFKFNDKCSSLKLHCNLPNDNIHSITLGGYVYLCADLEAVFIGYEDKDYCKRSITITLGPGKFVQYNELPGFNDKMSSFQFFFAQKNQYPKTI